MTKKNILVVFLALILSACASASPQKVGYTLFVSPDWSSYYRTSVHAEYIHQEDHGIYTVYIDARKDYSRSELPITSGTVTLSRVLFIGDADMLGSNNTPYEEAGSKTAKWDGEGVIRLTIFTKDQDGLHIERRYVDIINDNELPILILPEGQRIEINKNGVIAYLVEWKESTDN